jgi:CHAT domain-containing protein/Tfp pilus assembly protein PilF
MNVKGQFKEAEASAKQALNLSQKFGDKLRSMQAMLYLGSAYYYEGRMQEALEIFQQTTALAREIGNRKGLSRALNNTAGVLGDLGRYEESLSYMYQCMEVARELDDQNMLYTVLKNVGDLHIRLGDPDKAEAPLQESLRIAHQLKHSDLVRDPVKVATESSLLSLGQMEVARGHYQLALKYFEQAHASNPENPLFMIEMLTSMAEIHEKLGESQKSVELLQEAMTFAEKAASGFYPMILSNLGHSQESLGRLNDALASQQRALALVRGNGGNPDYEWQIESHIAHVDLALGRAEEALEHYQNSIAIIEHLRISALNTESGRAGILARNRATYAETADLLVALHCDAEALEMAERGRARAFLDMLVVSRGELPDELTPEQAQREEALLARISAIQKEFWKADASARENQQHKAELTTAEDDLEEFHLEVRRANPRYASVRYPEPISVSRIRNDLLDANTVLVEFLLGDKRSLAWVVSKDKLTVGFLPARKEIEEQVAEFRKSLTGKASALTLQTSLAEIDQRGKKLYASLFEPIEKTIPAGRTIIVVPDGVLGYLPFETLVAGTRRESSGETRPVYLVEKFALVYGPSASALTAVKSLSPQKPEWPKTLLAYGDPIAEPRALVAKNATATGATRTVSAESTTPTDIPDPNPAASAALSDYQERGFSLTRLPYTRDEVLSIGNLYPAARRQIYLGDQAKEETVKTQKLDQYRFIHFATHGFIDESVPDRSGILFSRDPDSQEDGILQTSEIMRLNLNADLVTLSACSTSLGKLVNGEGILGLTRAFFYSGARNVTVSLWNVNDSVTSVLMKAFYENLNHGLPKSEALRQAKLTLAHSRNATWQHPYFWAAFVLVGEGK